MITETYIRERAAELLGRCLVKYPKCKWEHRYSHLSFTDKTVLGQADAFGGLHISKAYIGSRDYDGLDDTILHEFAHLAAGIRAGHGAKWKRMAVLFGANPLSHGKASECFRENMYKYALIAHLADGRVVFAKGANRRSKAYNGYVRSRGARTYMIGGVDVDRFEYHPYSKKAELGL